MEQMTYSFHLSSDKNRKNISKVNSKNNLSGTSSLSNNAIQNARRLSKVDKHNYRKYDNKQDLIQIVRGTSSPYNDVINLYNKEFEEARLEYNSKQKRNDRKIDNYFDNISNNEKKDLACEIIIELGDKEYWDTKDIDYKKRMTSVYNKQVKDLEMLVPNFKVASAIIHYDETSPHMHIVGVPIKDKNKNGMSKQVGKSDVFTKESLIKLQDKMRTLCIDEFNQEYNLSNILKAKQKGRNRDINVKDMTNYNELKKELETNKEQVEITNRKSLELDNSTNEVKNIVSNLKNSSLRKENYILKEEDKNTLINYFDKVDKTNNDFKKINNISSILNTIEEELKDKNNNIQYLTEKNNALYIRIDSLSSENINQSNIIKKQNKEINNLKEENSSLKSKLNYYINKFKNLVRFLTNKMFNKDKNKYYEFSKDLYTHGILDYEHIKTINNNYTISNVDKEENIKEKDDYEL